MSSSHSLPDAFLSSLQGLPGYDMTAFERVHAEGAAVTSIRVNPAKGLGRGLIGVAGGVEAGNMVVPDAVPLERVPWSSMGYYLPERPSFTFDPLFHAGAYYVQEASSMFLEQALRQTTDLSGPLKVLDLCAAPGGKSTLIQSLLSKESLLISNEVIRARVNILQENMVKWGAVNTLITNNDPRDFGKMEGYFDVIVVDAPCSGSGLFRREPEAIGEWSPENVELCHQRQQRILADCWPALAASGILIYSTCSYSRQEDEDILDWMMGELDATGCRLDITADWGIVETQGAKGGYGYRFYPDKLKGEGFFISCVRKEAGGVYKPLRNKKGLEKLTRKEEDRMRGWIGPDIPLSFFHHQEYILGLPEQLAEDLAAWQASFYIKKAGVTIGQLTAKELIPGHDLALSTCIGPALPAVALSKEQAIQYLRKEEIAVTDAARGWTLVQYEGLNLGWIKVLPNRINNYYPKEWRILKR